MMRYLRRTTLCMADIGAFLITALMTHSLMEWPLTAIEGADAYSLTLIYILSFMLALCFFAYRGHYSWRTPWWQQVRQIVSFGFYCAVLDSLVNYTLYPSVHFQKIYIFTWILSIPVLLLMRCIARLFLKRLNHWNIKIILVGNVQNVINTLYALKSEFYLTYDIDHVVLNNATTSDIAEVQKQHGELRIKSALDEIPSHAMVIFCLGENDQIFLTETLSSIRTAGAKFAIVPPTTGFPIYGLQPQYFFGYNTVLMEMQPRLRTFWGSLAKQTMDRIFALIGLVILAPVFLFLMAKVTQDGGPAFYAQKRVGRNGKLFKCWKFRSMVVNADELLKDVLENSAEARAEWAKDFKLKDDPRITKIGHFLRKSSLDELPQLFNVLRGDMSIVGPRPIVRAEKRLYGERFGHYLSVRPGITGLWQVSGRNNVTYQQRVALDSWYVENWSVWNDLVIIFKTSFAVLNRKGAY